MGWSATGTNAGFGYAAVFQSRSCGLGRCKRGAALLRLALCESITNVIFHNIHYMTLSADQAGWRATTVRSEGNMIQTITLKKIGGSVGAILPKDMLVRQHLEANDEVFVVDTPQGILLTAVDPATTAALDAYAQVAKENRAAMATLARM